MIAHRPPAPSPTTATVDPGPHPAGQGGVVAGAHDIGEGEQARDQPRVGLAARHRHQGAVGEGNADPFALAGVGVALVVNGGAQNPPPRQDTLTWLRQFRQVPSHTYIGAITKSPTFVPVTFAPISSTTPTYS
jgi:hypothetical protein